MTQSTGNISEYTPVYDLETIQLKALWTLDHLSINSSKDRFTATEIAKFLVEEIGINTSRQAVRAALVKDTKLCNMNKDGFKIMKPGRDKLMENIGINKIIFIESGKPFSAKNSSLNDIFSKVSGVIRICDPYVDLNTLDVIFKNINKKNTINILTSKIIDKPSGIFSRQLQELRQEGFKIEVKIYNQSSLHDRYFMDDNTFWLSGNSLNHIGSRESFIVLLGEDIRQSMLATFNNRWKIAIPV